MGSHLKPGRSRFAWEVIRYVLAWALVVTAVVGLFWLLQEVLPDLVSSDATTTTTEATGATTTTEVSTTTSTSTTTTTTVPSETTTTTTVPEARPPEEVSVTVLNSTPRVGLAAEVAADLAELGYVVGQPANATPQRAVTTILYAEGFGIEAIELKEAAFEDEATVGIDDEGRTSSTIDIVVIIGDSYP